MSLQGANYFLFILIWNLTSGLLHYQNINIFCNYMTSLRNCVFLHFALLFLFKKTIEIYSIREILVTYVVCSWHYGNFFIFSNATTQINKLAFAWNARANKIKQIQEISLSWQNYFLWTNFRKFVGKYLPEKPFSRKVFNFFKRINIESFHAETSSTEKMRLFWKKIIK